MKKAITLFGLVLSLALVSAAQVRTITNSTLQKFQEQRIAAQQEYRDNYARLGFPSPEELDRQRDEDMASRIELADQLRHARLEKERLELERRSLDIQAFTAEAQAAESYYNREYGREYAGYPVAGYGGYGGYGYGYGGYYGGYDGFNGRFGDRRRVFDRLFNDGGYRATAVGSYHFPGARVRGLLRGGRGISRTGRR